MITMANLFFSFHKKDEVFMDEDRNAALHSMSFEKACVKVYNKIGVSYFVSFKNISGTDISAIMDTLSICKDKWPGIKGPLKNFFRYRIHTGLDLVTKIFDLPLPLSVDEMSEMVHSIYVDLFHIQHTPHGTVLQLYIHPKLTLATEREPLWIHELTRFTATIADSL